jgi:hypothetical protein
MKVRVRFKDAPRMPCPAATNSAAEIAAWQCLRGRPVTLVAPISACQVRNMACGSDTYWLVEMDEHVRAAVLEHTSEPMANRYAVCRHVLEMGD